MKKVDRASLSASVYAFQAMPGQAAGSRQPDKMDNLFFTGFGVSNKWMLTAFQV
jgi:hypothetical protein